MVKYVFAILFFLIMISYSYLFLSSIILWILLAGWLGFYGMPNPVSMYIKYIRFLNCR